MQSAFLGVLMALFGNGMIGLSFSVMKVAHSRNPSGGSYLKIPLWWAGNAMVRPSDSTPPSRVLTLPRGGA